MKFLNNLSITIRLNILISFALIVIFIVLGVVFYNYQKVQMFADVKTDMSKEVEELTKLTDYELDKNNESLDIALKTLTYLVRTVKEIGFTKNTYEVEAINQQTKEKTIITLPEMVFDNKPIYNNLDFVNKVKLLTGADAAIYQKFPDGYINISANFNNDKGNSFVDTYIPNSSPILEIIENGEIYKGKAIQSGNWYISAYKPLYINGKLEGMIYVGIKEEIAKNLGKFFLHRNYFETGYPFLMDKKGTMKIHPSLEGANISKSALYKQMVATKKDSIVSIRYFWPENSNGKWKYLYYRYYPRIEDYICVSFYESDLLSVLNGLISKIILVVFFSSILIIIIVSSILKTITKIVNNLGDRFVMISNGLLVEKIEYNKNDEFGIMIAAVNRLIEGLRRRVAFANEIGKGNLAAELITLGDSDIMGRALLQMRSSLVASRDEDQKRRNEDDIRLWTNDGLSKFVEILRVNVNDVSEFSYNIISNMVSYLKANQGAMFVVNDDDSSDVYLEQVATYAYSQRRIIQKKIPLGASLLSRAMLEKKSIYMVDIPADYISISSGLGESKPNAMVIVPLIYNEIVYGVVEIATFTHFEPYQIEFVEKIGESIASTISSVKINNKTAELLRQSQEQSVKMAQQEKEMRENLKELKLLQEEADRKSTEMHGVISAIDATSIVIEFSKEAKILNVNDKFTEVFSMEREKAIGKKHSELSSMDENSDDYQNLWTDLLMGHSKTVVEHISIPKGEIWLSQTFTPMHDNQGHIYKILNIATDVTENKVLEKQLRKQVREMRDQEKDVEQKIVEYNEIKKQLTDNEKHFNSYYNALNSVFSMIEIDTDGKIISVNDKFLQLTDNQENDITSQNIRRHINRDELTKFNIALEKVSMNQTQQIELNFVTKTLDKIQQKLILTAIKNNEGEMEKVLLIGI